MKCPETASHPNEQIILRRVHLQNTVHTKWEPFARVEYLKIQVTLVT